MLALRLVVQAGSLLLIARMLGPSQYGVFAGVASFSVLLSTLSTLGMHLVILSEISKDDNQRESLLSIAIPVTLLCSGILLGIFLVSCQYLLPVDKKINTWIVFLIASAEIIVQPLCALLVAELLALERTVQSQILQLLPLVLRLGAAVLIYIVDLPDPLFAYSGCHLAAAMVAFIFIMKNSRVYWPPFRKWKFPSEEELRRSMSYAFLNVTAVGPAEIDKVLAARLLSLSDAGLYAAGSRIIGAAVLPVSALMLSVMPRFFREGLNGSSPGKRLLKWSLGSALVYSVFLSVALWISAPAVSWLFGNDYRSMEKVIRWLCLALPAFALRIVAGNALLALKRTWIRSFLEMTGVVVLVGGAVIFAPEYHVYGMLWALISAEWIMAIMGFFILSASSE